MKKFVFTTLAVWALAGCSIAPWKSEYACPGMPTGVICKSPIEVYRLTENSDRVLESSSRAPAAGAEGGAARARTDNAYLPSQMSPGRAMPRDALPILEPARVMRVWVAPYIDAKEDMHMPGYVLTQVTPRQWTFGEASALKVRPLVPLQLDYKDRAQVDADGSGVDIGDEAKALIPKAIMQSASQLPAAVKSSSGK